MARHLRRDCRVADRATIAALGWRGGDRLTLTADDTLAAYSFTVVDQAMRAHARLPHGEGGRS